jgi:hypothetical protein
MIANLAIIILSASLRILPHPPNMAPIGGLALFSGATLPLAHAIILPLTAMIISDAVLGFHGTMIYVYGSFILIAILGRLIKSNRSVGRLAGISLMSSTLFFLVTNFGVWATGSMYPKNISGLINCYLLGLPFFRNTIIGDLLYTGLFFYGYALALLLKKKFFHRISTAKTP